MQQLASSKRNLNLFLSSISNRISKLERSLLLVISGQLERCFGWIECYADMFKLQLANNDNDLTTTHDLSTVCGNETPAFCYGTITV